MAAPDNIETITNNKNSRGNTTFKSRKDGAEKDVDEKTREEENDAEIQTRRPYLNRTAARNDQTTSRNFTRRRLGGAYTTSRSISSTTSAPISRRPFRVASRRRPVATTKTTTTTTTTQSTSNVLESEEFLQDVEETDSIENPSITSSSNSKNRKIQRRPLISLKVEQDQNPAATSEEEKKRQSKKYSSSFKQNQLDEVLKLKAQDAYGVDIDPTTDGKSTVESYSAETAVALAAHKLLEAPVPIVHDYEYEEKPSRSTLGNIENLSYTSDYNKEVKKTPSYPISYSTTPNYKTSTEDNNIQTSTDPVISSDLLETLLPSTGPFKASQPAGFTAPTITNPGLSGISRILGPSTVRYLSTTDQNTATYNINPLDDRYTDNSEKYSKSPPSTSQYVSTVNKYSGVSYDSTPTDRYVDISETSQTLSQTDRTQNRRPTTGRKFPDTETPQTLPPPTPSTKIPIYQNTYFDTNNGFTGIPQGPSVTHEYTSSVDKYTDGFQTAGPSTIDYLDSTRYTGTSERLNPTNRFTVTSEKFTEISRDTNPSTATYFEDGKYTRVSQDEIPVNSFIGTSDTELPLNKYTDTNERYTTVQNLSPTYTYTETSDTYKSISRRRKPSTTSTENENVTTETQQRTNPTNRYSSTNERYTEVSRRRRPSTNAESEKYTTRTLQNVSPTEAISSTTGRSIASRKRGPTTNSYTEQPATEPSSTFGFTDTSAYTNAPRRTRPLTTKYTDVITDTPVILQNSGPTTGLPDISEKFTETSSTEGPSTDIYSETFQKTTETPFISTDTVIASKKYSEISRSPSTSTYVESVEKHDELNEDDVSTDRYFTPNGQYTGIVQDHQSSTAKYFNTEGRSQSVSPSSIKYPSTTDKYVSGPIDDFSYSTAGYSHSQEPSHFTREYLLASPVTKTYDDEYQYLSPMNSNQPSSTTRKVARKKTVFRRISTTASPSSTTTTTTPKPRKVVSRKPFEKIRNVQKVKVLKNQPDQQEQQLVSEEQPVKEIQTAQRVQTVQRVQPVRKVETSKVNTVIRPIGSYDYYDDSEEKVIQKYEEETKVILHGKAISGSIPSTTAAKNTPHPYRVAIHRRPVSTSNTTSTTNTTQSFTIILENEKLLENIEDTTVTEHIEDTSITSRSNSKNRTTQRRPQISLKIQQDQNPAATSEVEKNRQSKNYSSSFKKSQLDEVLRLKTHNEHDIEIDPTTNEKFTVERSFKASQPAAFTGTTKITNVSRGTNQSTATYFEDSNKTRVAHDETTVNSFIGTNDTELSLNTGISTNKYTNSNERYTTAQILSPTYTYAETSDKYKLVSQLRHPFTTFTESENVSTKTQQQTNLTNIYSSTNESYTEALRRRRPSTNSSTEQPTAKSSTFGFTDTSAYTNAPRRTRPLTTKYTDEITDTTVTLQNSGQTTGHTGISEKLTETSSSIRPSTDIYSEKLEKTIKTPLRSTDTATISKKYSEESLQNSAQTTGHTGISEKFTETLSSVRPSIDIHSEIIEKTRPLSTKYTNAIRDSAVSLQNSGQTTGHTDISEKITKTSSLVRPSTDVLSESFDTTGSLMAKYTDAITDTTVTLQNSDQTTGHTGIREKFTETTSSVRPSTDIHWETFEKNRPLSTKYTNVIRDSAVSLQNSGQTTGHTDISEKITKTSSLVRPSTDVLSESFDTTGSLVAKYTDAITDTTVTLQNSDQTTGHTGIREKFTETTSSVRPSTDIHWETFEKNRPLSTKYTNAIRDSAVSLQNSGQTTGHTGISEKFTETLSSVRPSIDIHSEIIEKTRPLSTKYTNAIRDSAVTLQNSGQTTGHTDISEKVTKTSSLVRPSTDVLSESFDTTGSLMAKYMDEITDTTVTLQNSGQTTGHTGIREKFTDTTSSVRPSTDIYSEKFEKTIKTPLLSTDTATISKKYSEESLQNSAQTTGHTGISEKFTETLSSVRPSIDIHSEIIEKTRPLSTKYTNAIRDSAVSLQNSDQTTGHTGIRGKFTETTSSVRPSTDIYWETFEKNRPLSTKYTNAIRDSAVSLQNSGQTTGHTDISEKITKTSSLVRPLTDVLSESFDTTGSLVAKYTDAITDTTVTLQNSDQTTGHTGIREKFTETTSSVRPSTDIHWETFEKNRPLSTKYTNAIRDSAVSLQNSGQTTGHTDISEKITKTSSSVRPSTDVLSESFDTTGSLMAKYMDEITDTTVTLQNSGQTTGHTGISEKLTETSSSIRPSIDIHSEIIEKTRPLSTKYTNAIRDSAVSLQNSGQTTGHTDISEKITKTSSLVRPSTDVLSESFDTTGSLMAKYTDAITDTTVTLQNSDQTTGHTGIREKFTETTSSVRPSTDIHWETFEKNRPLSTKYTNAIRDSAVSLQNSGQTTGHTDISEKITKTSSLVRPSTDVLSESFDTTGSLMAKYMDEITDTTVTLQNSGQTTGHTGISEKLTETSSSIRPSTDIYSEKFEKTIKTPLLSTDTATISKKYSEESLQNSAQTTGHTGISEKFTETLSSVRPSIDIHSEIIEKTRPLSTKYTNAIRDSAVTLQNSGQTTGHTDISEKITKTSSLVRPLTDVLSESFDTTGSLTTKYTDAITDTTVTLQNSDQTTGHTGISEKFTETSSKVRPSTDIYSEKFEKTIKTPLLSTDTVTTSKKYFEVSLQDSGLTNGHTGISEKFTKTSSSVRPPTGKHSEIIEKTRTLSTKYTDAIRDTAVTLQNYDQNTGHTGIMEKFTETSYAVRPSTSTYLETFEKIGPLTKKYTDAITDTTETFQNSDQTTGHTSVSGKFTETTSSVRPSTDTHSETFEKTRPSSTKYTDVIRDTAVTLQNSNQTTGHTEKSENFTEASTAVRPSTSIYTETFEKIGPLTTKYTDAITDTTVTVDGKVPSIRYLASNGQYTGSVQDHQSSITRYFIEEESQNASPSSIKYPSTTDKYVSGSIDAFSSTASSQSQEPSYFKVLNTQSAQREQQLVSDEQPAKQVQTPQRFQTVQRVQPVRRVETSELNYSDSEEKEEETKMILHGKVTPIPRRPFRVESRRRPVDTTNTTSTSNTTQSTENILDKFNERTDSIEDSSITSRSNTKNLTIKERPLISLNPKQDQSPAATSEEEKNRQSQNYESSFKQNQLDEVLRLKAQDAYDIEIDPTTDEKLTVERAFKASQPAAFNATTTNTNVSRVTNQPTATYIEDSKYTSESQDATPVNSFIGTNDTELSLDTGISTNKYTNTNEKYTTMQNQSPTYSISQRISQRRKPSTTSTENENVTTKTQQKTNLTNRYSTSASYSEASRRRRPSTHSSTEQPTMKSTTFGFTVTNANTNEPRRTRPLTTKYTDTDATLTLQNSGPTTGHTGINEKFTETSSRVRPSTYIYSESFEKTVPLTTKYTDTITDTTVTLQNSGQTTGHTGISEKFTETSSRVRPSTDIHSETFEKTIKTPLLSTDTVTISKKYSEVSLQDSGLTNGHMGISEKFTETSSSVRPSTDIHSEIIEKTGPLSTKYTDAITDTTVTLQTSGQTTGHTDISKKLTETSSAVKPSTYLYSETFEKTEPLTTKHTDTITDTTVTLQNSDQTTGHTGISEKFTKTSSSVRPSTDIHSGTFEKTIKTPLLSTDFVTISKKYSEVSLQDSGLTNGHTGISEKFTETSSSVRPSTDIHSEIIEKTGPLSTKYTDAITDTTVTLQTSGQTTGHTGISKKLTETSSAVKPSTYIYSETFEKTGPLTTQHTDTITDTTVTLQNSDQTTRHTGISEKFTKTSSRVRPSTDIHSGTFDKTIKTPLIFTDTVITNKKYSEVSRSPSTSTYVESVENHTGLNDKNVSSNRYFNSNGQYTGIVQDHQSSTAKYFTEEINQIKYPSTSDKYVLGAKDDFSYSTAGYSQSQEPSYFKDFKMQSVQKEQLVSEEKPVKQVETAYRVQTVQRVQPVGKIETSEVNRAVGSIDSHNYNEASKDRVIQKYKEETTKILHGMDIVEDLSMTSRSNSKNWTIQRRPLISLKVEQDQNSAATGEEEKNRQSNSYSSSFKLNQFDEVQRLKSQGSSKFTVESHSAETILPSTGNIKASQPAGFTATTIITNVSRESNQPTATYFKDRRNTTVSQDETPANSFIGTNNTELSFNTGISTNKYTNTNERYTTVQNLSPTYTYAETSDKYKSISQRTKPLTTSPENENGTTKTQQITNPTNRYSSTNERYTEASRRRPSTNISTEKPTTESPTFGFTVTSAYTNAPRITKPLTTKYTDAITDTTVTLQNSGQTTGYTGISEKFTETSSSVRPPTYIYPEIFEKTGPLMTKYTDTITDTTVTLQNSGQTTGHTGISEKFTETSSRVRPSTDIHSGIFEKTGPLTTKYTDTITDTTVTLQNSGQTTGQTGISEKFTDTSSRVRPSTGIYSETFEKTIQTPLISTDTAIASKKYSEVSRSPSTSTYVESVEKHTELNDNNVSSNRYFASNGQYTGIVQDDQRSTAKYFTEEGSQSVSPSSIKYPSTTDKYVLGAKDDFSYSTIGYSQSQEPSYFKVFKTQSVQKEQQLVSEEQPVKQVQTAHRVQTVQRVQPVGKIETSEVNGAIGSIDSHNYNEASKERVIQKYKEETKVILNGIDTVEDLSMNSRSNSKNLTIQRRPLISLKVEQDQNSAATGEEEKNRQSNSYSSSFKLNQFDEVQRLKSQGSSKFTVESHSAETMLPSTGTIKPSQTAGFTSTTIVTNVSRESNQPTATYFEDSKNTTVSQDEAPVNSFIGTNDSELSLNTGISTNKYTNANERYTTVQNLSPTYIDAETSDKYKSISQRTKPLTENENVTTKTQQITNPTNRYSSTNERYTEASRRRRPSTNSSTKKPTTESSTFGFTVTSAYTNAPRSSRPLTTKYTDAITDTTVTLQNSGQTTGYTGISEKFTETSSAVRPPTYINSGTFEKKFQTPLISTDTVIASKKYSEVSRSPSTSTYVESVEKHTELNDKNVSSNRNFTSNSQYIGIVQDDQSSTAKYFTEEGFQSVRPSSIKYPSTTDKYVLGAKDDFNYSTAGYSQSQEPSYFKVFKTQSVQKEQQLVSEQPVKQFQTAHRVQTVQRVQPVEKIETSELNRAIGSIDSLNYNEASKERVIQKYKEETKGILHGTDTVEDLSMTSRSNSKNRTIQRRPLISLKVEQDQNRVSEEEKNRIYSSSFKQNQFDDVQRPNSQGSSKFTVESHRAETMLLSAETIKASQPAGFTSTTIVTNVSRESNQPTATYFEDSKNTTVSQDEAPVNSFIGTNDTELSLNTGISTNKYTNANERYTTVQKLSPTYSYAERSDKYKSISQRTKPLTTSTENENVTTKTQQITNPTNTTNNTRHTGISERFTETSSRVGPTTNMHSGTIEKIRPLSTINTDVIRDTTMTLQNSGQTTGYTGISKKFTKTSSAVRPPTYIYPEIFEETGPLTTKYTDAITDTTVTLQNSGQTTGHTGISEKFTETSSRVRPSTDIHSGTFEKTIQTPSITTDTVIASKKYSEVSRSPSTSTYVESVEKHTELNDKNVSSNRNFTSSGHYIGIVQDHQSSTAKYFTEEGSQNISPSSIKYPSTTDKYVLGAKDNFSYSTGGYSRSQEPSYFKVFKTQSVRKEQQLVSEEQPVKQVQTAHRVQTVQRVQPVGKIETSEVNRAIGSIDSHNYNEASNERVIQKYKEETKVILHGKETSGSIPPTTAAQAEAITRRPFRVVSRRRPVVTTNATSTSNTTQSTKNILDRFNERTANSGTAAQAETISRHPFRVVSRLRPVVTTNTTSTSNTTQSTENILDKFNERTDSIEDSSITTRSNSKNQTIQTRPLISMKVEQNQNTAATSEEEKNRQSKSYSSSLKQNQLDEVQRLKAQGSSKFTVESHRAETMLLSAGTIKSSQPAGFTSTTIVTNVSRESNQPTATYFEDSKNTTVSQDEAPVNSFIGTNDTELSLNTGISTNKYTNANERYTTVQKLSSTYTYAERSDKYKSISQNTKPLTTSTENENVTTKTQQITNPTNRYSSTNERYTEASRRRRPSTNSSTEKPTTESSTFGFTVSSAYTNAPRITKPLTTKYTDAITNTTVTLQNSGQTSGHTGISEKFMKTSSRVRPSTDIHSGTFEKTIKTPLISTDTVIASKKYSEVSRSPSTSTYVESVEKNTELNHNNVSSNSNFTSNSQYIGIVQDDQSSTAKYFTEEGSQNISPSSIKYPSTTDKYVLGAKDNFNYSTAGYSRSQEPSYFKVFKTQSVRKEQQLVSEEQPVKQVQTAHRVQTVQRVQPVGKIETSEVNGAIGSIDSHNYNEASNERVIQKYKEETKVILHGKETSGSIPPTTAAQAEAITRRPFRVVSRRRPVVTTNATSTSNTTQSTKNILDRFNERTANSGTAAQAEAISRHPFRVVSRLRPVVTTNTTSTSNTTQSTENILDKFNERTDSIEDSSITSRSKSKNWTIQTRPLISLKVEQNQNTAATSEEEKDRQSKTNTPNLKQNQLDEVQRPKAQGSSKFTVETIPPTTAAQAESITRRPFRVISRRRPVATTNTTSTTNTTQSTTNVLDTFNERTATSGSIPPTTAAQAEAITRRPFRVVSRRRPVATTNTTSTSNTTQSTKNTLDTFNERTDSIEDSSITSRSYSKNWTIQTRPLISLKVEQNQNTAATSEEEKDRQSKSYSSSLEQNQLDEVQRLKAQGSSKLTVETNSGSIPPTTAAQAESITRRPFRVISRRRPVATTNTTSTSNTTQSTKNILDTFNEQTDSIEDSSITTRSYSKNWTIQTRPLISLKVEQNQNTAATSEEERDRQSKGYSSSLKQNQLDKVQKFKAQGSSKLTVETTSGSIPPTTAAQAEAITRRPFRVVSRRRPVATTNTTFTTNTTQSTTNILDKFNERTDSIEDSSITSRSYSKNWTIQTRPLISLKVEQNQNTAATSEEEKDSQSKSYSSSLKQNQLDEVQRLKDQGSSKLTVETTSGSIPPTTAAQAEAITRRPFRVVSRRRPVATTNTTSTTNTTQSTTNILDTFNERTDSTEDSSITSGSYSKNWTIQTRPLISLKVEQNENTAATSEEEKDRQSKSYSSSLKQNQLDEVQRLKAQGSSKLTVETTSGSIPPTTAAQAEAITRRPFRVVSRRRPVATTNTTSTTNTTQSATNILDKYNEWTDSIENSNSYSKNRTIQTLKSLKVEQEQNSAATNVEGENRQSKSYSSSFKQNQLDEEQRLKAQGSRKFTVESHSAETMLPSTGTIKASQPAGFTATTIITNVSRESNQPTATYFEESKNTTVSQDEAPVNSFIGTNDTELSLNTGISTNKYTSTNERYTTVQILSPTYTYTETSDKYKSISQKTKPLTTSTENLNVTIKTQQITNPTNRYSSTNERYTEASLARRPSTNSSTEKSTTDSSTFTSAYTNAHRSTRPLTTKNTIKITDTTVTSQNSGPTTVFTSTSNGTNDENLSPETSNQPSTTTRKLARKKTEVRRISTTTSQSSSTTSTTTPRPRTVVSKEPKVLKNQPVQVKQVQRTQRVQTAQRVQPVRKVETSEVNGAIRPVGRNYHNDDSKEKVIQKQEKETKVIVHGRRNIECLDIGNFPHPSSCKKFIACTRTKSGTLRGTEYTCPTGLLFDPVSRICNWSAEVTCN